MPLEYLEVGPHVSVNSSSDCFTPEYVKVLALCHGLLGPSWRSGVKAGGGDGSQGFEGVLGVGDLVPDGTGAKGSEGADGCPHFPVKGLVGWAGGGLNF